MAQFDFLGSWDDSWRIMASILGIDHIRVIPNLKFDRAEPTFISILDEGAKALLLQWRFVCLFSTKFSRFPPEMHRIEGGVNSGKYSVDLAAGGPGLGLSLPACYEKDGRWNLACGMLYYARNTLNRETGLWEKPTPELVAGYKEVKGVIRRHLVGRHDFAKGVPIGRDAIRLLQEGKARVAGVDD